MIIAIDGPAGAGKSTVARGVAKRLGFQFLDTGAMYRAVALVALEQGVDFYDEIPDDEPVTKIAREIDLFVDGEVTRIGERDVSSQIRTQQVSDASSKVAAIPGVRKELVNLQRKVAAGRDYVCEGRDQGSIVFPDAEFKFYVTASIEERAKRRWRDLVKHDPDLKLEQVIVEQEDRDRRDSEREIGALQKAADAIEVHTNAMSSEQVIEAIVTMVSTR